MTSRFNQFVPYEKRVEYNPTPQDTAIECALLADMSDEIMEVPSSIGTEQSSDAFIDKVHTSIHRAFRYLDSDRQGGWHWPLVEKELVLSYERHLDDDPIESYRIQTNTHIHQINIETHTIATTYDISYTGIARSAVEATVRSLNLTEPGDEQYSVRPMTSYDSETLCDELIAFDALLRSSKQEDIRARQQEGL